MTKNEHRTYIVHYGKEIVEKLSELSPPLNISLYTLIGQLTTHLIENLDDKGIHRSFIRGYMENINNISLDNYFENKRHDD